MKMLDYVQLAHVRMGENLERSSELVAQLVDIFQSGSFDALRIVASGSSRHAADCARDYLQDALQMQVSVVTPEAFVDFEHTYPQHALNIAVSQSGYSTNTIAALDYMRAHDMAAVALTANVEAPIKEHADIVLDYGVGVESVDFVTLGVRCSLSTWCSLVFTAVRRAERLTPRALPSVLTTCARPSRPMP